MLDDLDRLDARALCHPALDASDYLADEPKYALQNSARQRPLRILGEDERRHQLEVRPEAPIRQIGASNRSEDGVFSYGQEERGVEYARTAPRPEHMHPERRACIHHSIGDDQRVAHAI